MAEFTPITSQEQLDQVLSDRLTRERAKYADYDQLKSDRERLQGELKTEKEVGNGLRSQIGDLQKKIGEYETNSVKMRIAEEEGLPKELRDRLQGKTEEELRADAKRLSEAIGKRRTQPLHNPESEKNDKNEELKNVLKGLKLGG